MTKRLLRIVPGLVFSCTVSLSCFAQQVGLEGNVRLEITTQNFGDKIPVNLQNGVGGDPMDQSGPSEVQDKRRFSDIQEAYAFAFDTTINPGSPHLSQQFRLLEENNTVEYDIRNELTSDFGEARLMENIDLTLTGSGHSIINAQLYGETFIKSDTLKLTPTDSELTGEQVWVTGAIDVTVAYSCDVPLTGYPDAPETVNPDSFLGASITEGSRNAPPNGSGSGKFIRVDENGQSETTSFGNSGNYSIDVSFRMNLGEDSPIGDESFQHKIILELGGYLLPGDYALGIDVTTRWKEIHTVMVGGVELSQDDVTLTSASGFDYNLNLGNQAEPVDGIEWKNPEGGAFNAATNWDPEMVPGIDDNAIFGLGSTYTVDAFTDETPHLVDRLILGGDPAAIVVFQNTALRAQNTSAEQPGVAVNNGEFRLLGGTLESNHAVIGTSAATRATLSSFAGNSVWENAGRITIGGGGETQFRILGGGKLFSGESLIGAAADGIAFGSMTLESEGSEWDAGALSVGVTSHGSLDVLQGGKVSASTVHVGGPENIGDINVEGIDTLSGKASQLFVSEDLAIGTGESGLGAVQLKDGAVAVVDGLVYLGNEGVGLLNVIGKHPETELPTVLNASAGMFVGFVSDGSIVLEEGATILSGVTLVGDHGKVTARDHGSSWILSNTLFLGEGGGESGPGELEVLAGARVSAPEIHVAGLLSVIGQEDDQASSVTAAGKLIFAQLENENATAIVNGGGIIEANSFEFAEGMDSIVVVQIAGVGPDGIPSALHQNGTNLALIGDYGTVSLDVLDGAFAEFNGMVIVGGQDGSADLDIQGVDEASNTRSTVRFNGESVNIAFGGAGILNIAEGGYAVCQSLLIYPGGQLTVNGFEGAYSSYLEAAEEIDVSGMLTLDAIGAATIGNIEPVAGKLRVGPGGSLSGNGTIAADKENGGGVDSFTGSIISPGASPGKLTIDGQYTAEPGSYLLVEISGTETGLQHDQVFVTGDVDFRGTVILKFLDGFAPSIGQEFAFIETQGNARIDIEAVRVANLEPGFEFNIDTVEGKTTLSAENDGIYRAPPEIRLFPGLTNEGRFYIDIQGGGIGDQFKIERSSDMQEWIRVGTRTKLNDEPSLFLGDAPEEKTLGFYRVANGSAQ